MSSKKQANAPLITRDWLAIERTRLANERTFLAYLRTSIGFLAAGLTILKFELFESLRALGWVMTVLSPLLFAFGLYRVWRVAQKIDRTYDSEQVQDQETHNGGRQDDPVTDPDVPA